VNVVRGMLLSAATTSKCRPTRSLTTDARRRHTLAAVFVAIPVDIVIPFYTAYRVSADGA